MNILHSPLPLPPSLPPALLRLPFFPLFQINRVALIQCVSCRLPRRLFDPVFQSLPLGQTCFSSVCCTPALAATAATAAAAATALIQTHLTVISSHCLFFSSISLTFSPFFKPSPLPACSLCFPSFSPQKPLFSSGVQAALRGRPLGREGEPDSCFSPLSLRLSLCYLSVCTLDLISLSSQSSPSTILTHPHSSSTFTCSTQIIAGVWLQF